MSVFDNASPPVPVAAPFLQRLREFGVDIRPFLRWLSHFLVNGFVLGLVVSIYLSCSIISDFTTAIAKRLNNEIAVRVVMVPDVTKERALQLAREMAVVSGETEEVLRYQAFDSEQGRALLGIHESWLPDLPEMTIEKLPVVLELRQWPGRRPVDLPQIAERARKWQETESVFFNSAGWLETRQINNDMQFISVFFSRFVIWLIPIAVIFTCLLSGIGLRHRRWWLIPVGLLVASLCYFLTVWGMSILIEKILRTTPPARLISITSFDKSVLMRTYWIVLLFWGTVEMTRLRLRGR